MKNLLIAVAFLSGSMAMAQTPCNGGNAGPYPCNGYDLQSEIGLNVLDADNANDSWGWTDPQDGSEYALVGLSNGTAFIDISDPVNPVYLGKLPTETSSTLWRDLKVYNNHVFIVSEAGGHGMQIFDLTHLRDVASPPVTFEADLVYDQFGGSAHNIVINEETGYAYPVGTGAAGGGVHFINVQDPMNPINEGDWQDVSSVHDSQVVVYNGPDTDYQGREILINSVGWGNVVSIVDITDKSDPQLISSFNYSNPAYTHQGWFTADHRYFILGDEIDESNVGFNTRTLVFDLEDLDNPEHKFDYYGPTEAIDHNGYIVGDKYYLANYTAGLRVLDVSDIANDNITEIGYFDSYPDGHPVSYEGAWSVYPFFGSGNIVISDMQRGFVLVKSSEVDTEDPEAVCQDITVSLDENGEVVVNAADVDGGSTDNSGSMSFSLDQNEFDCSDIGAVNVTLTVTDPSGNTDTCNAVVTIEDNMGPAFTECHENETITLDEGQTTYTLPDYVAEQTVEAADNCEGAVDYSQDPTAGTELGIGTHTITVTAEDEYGNTNSCSFDIEVEEFLGIGTNQLELGLSIYPNPSKGMIFVESSVVLLEQIVVTDIAGKRVMEVNEIDQLNSSVDLSAFTKGVYFLTINDQITKRIVKY